ncbi:hypothetical protein HYN43_010860 [Mucilaginibacter celer]|uniref:Uncharacterized protein n=2 Tax=Mucilaginibacter celer TaxID=2305508 RepID=A0A494VWS0_9SPHI|nr:hypothetical protein HYN43_010860 [Mucilaginibacter celer]
MVLLLFVVSINAMGQDKIKTIGNKLRSGSTNTTFDAVKGKLVGVEMNAGKKQVQLLKLSFHTANRSSDSVAFKVNVYQMAGKYPNNVNLVTDEVKGYIQKYRDGNPQLTTIDLSAYNIKVAGDIVVAIEFLETKNGSNIGFSCGLLNGGTFHRDSEAAGWKKIPVVGADFSVRVKKLN